MGWREKYQEEFGDEVIITPNPTMVSEVDKEEVDPVAEANREAEKQEQSDSLEDTLTSLEDTLNDVLKDLQ